MVDSKKNKVKKSKILDEIKLEQYRRCSEDWRHLESIMFWHIPTILIMVASVVLGAYGYLSKGLGRVFLLFVASLLMIAVNVSLAKHRLGSEGRAEMAGKIAEEYFGVGKIPVKTSDIVKKLLKNKKVPLLVRFLRKRSAYYWLQHVSLLILIFMIILTVCEFVKILL